MCAPPNMLALGPGAAEGGGRPPTLGGASLACVPFGDGCCGRGSPSLSPLHSILRGAAATKPERVAGGGTASRHWRRAKMGLAHTSGGKGRAAARSRERDGRSRGPGGDVVQFERRPESPRVGMSPQYQVASKPAPLLHTMLPLPDCARLRRLMVRVRRLLAPVTPAAPRRAAPMTTRS